MLRAGAAFTLHAAGAGVDLPTASSSLSTGAAGTACARLSAGSTLAASAATRPAVGVRRRAVTSPQAHHCGERDHQRAVEETVHDPHFVSHATPVAVQNIPDVFPDVPSWHIGSVESWQSVLPVHIVVQAAKTWLWFEQLKQVVPDAQGFPHSAAKVVQVPCRQVTPGVALN